MKILAPWMLAVGCASAASFLLAAKPDSAPTKATVDYLRDVKPILAKRCYECHGVKEQKSGLRLDTVAGALEGGDSGPALVAGKSAESLIVAAITGTGDASPMPPEGAKLSAKEIETIKLWIDSGAQAPTDEKVVAATVKKSDHWSFQPVSSTAAPKAKNEAWVRNPIDAFILAKLEAAGIQPSPEADPYTLCRRLYLDLTGLPPTPEEVDEFIKSFASSSAENAYEALVDKLLASPHYGERWGRHWLDLARYADSNGYTIDGGRTIWKYRDWVINALNRDLPFDAFTIEQIAGDMLPKASVDQIVATGFHRNTLRNEEGGTDQEQFRVEAVVDRVSTTGSVFLGLTVGCARCHDHKYDPISQREFYQLFALLNNADEPTYPLPTDQQSKEEPALKAEIAQMEKRLEEVDLNSAGRQFEWEDRLVEQIKKLEKDNDAPDVLTLVASVRQALEVPRDKRTGPQKNLLIEEFRKQDRDRIALMVPLQELKDRLKQLQSKITTTLVMKERAKPRETFVHLRGDFLRTGAKVSPAVPAVLPALKAADGKTPNRLDFARWLVDAQNPLTPRVTMNRFWQQYFGQGLVVTENDFGTQGERPTHPELLDWLAREFVQRGWSMKAMHRLIVTSATYRQSSHLRNDLHDKDPNNKLLARQSRLRLEAEVIRDVSLAASGLLSREVGGPSVYPPQPEGIYRFTQQVKYWKEASTNDRYRRGLYTYFWRSSPYPFLTTFDAPDANVTCTRRVRSNTPLQALTLANDKAFFEIAQGLAGRLLEESTGSDEKRIEHGVQLCLARKPTEVEAKRLLEFVKQQRQSFATASKEAENVAPRRRPPQITAAEGAAWTAVARVLMNLDEFVTRE
jgi:hypothetical protein